MPLPEAVGAVTIGGVNLGRAIVMLGCALLACASLGPFVWVDDYAAAAAPGADGEPYRIAAGDLLSVKVYNQEGLSVHERVRQDGRVSLPLLRDVQAAGLPPDALAEQIQTRLLQFINAPLVTVAVEEARSLSVPVLGEVARPGQFSLDRGAGVLEALAAAGGMTPFAHQDRIFVLRRTPAPIRIRLTFEALSRGQGRAATLRLQGGDSVVVE